MPHLRYVIVGRGADSTRLRRRVEELGLSDHVVLTGFVPEDELPDHYRLCDIFVMPSQAEGFGIVFLEALACGRRVVAGNGDGSAEPLLAGKLGHLLIPTTPTRWRIRCSVSRASRMIRPTRNSCAETWSLILARWHSGAGLGEVLG